MKPKLQNECQILKRMTKISKKPPELQIEPQLLKEHQISNETKITNEPQISESKSKL